MRGGITFRLKPRFLKADIWKEVDQSTRDAKPVVRKNPICTLKQSWGRGRRRRRRRRDGDEKRRTLVVLSRSLCCLYQFSGLRGSKRCFLAKSSKNLRLFLISCHDAEINIKAHPCHPPTLLIILLIMTYIDKTRNYPTWSLGIKLEPHSRIPWTFEWLLCLPSVYR